MSSITTDLRDIKNLLNQGDYDTAFDFYEMLLAEHPGNASILHDYGLAHYTIGDHDKALTFFDSALSIVPQDTIALVAKGELYAIGYGPTGDFAEAIPLFQQVLLFAPHDKTMQVVSYVQIGLIITDAAKKIEAYEAAIKINNYCFEAHWNLAGELWKQEKFHESEREWTIVKQIGEQNNQPIDTAQRYLECVQQHRSSVPVGRYVLSILQPWLSDLIS